MFVLVFVPELHGDLVIGERKQLFAKLVIVFFLPFLGEELDDLVGALDELVAVSPDGVGRVGFGDGLWVSVRFGSVVALRSPSLGIFRPLVPQILRYFHLLMRRFGCKRWCQRHCCVFDRFGMI